MFLTGAASITDSLTGALSTVAGEMTGAIGAVLPIALPVLGGIMVVTVGIKAFKRFSK